MQNNEMLTETRGDTSLRVWYDEAMMLDAFIATAKANRELWEATMRRATVPDDLVRRAAAIAAPRHLLVLHEDWCGDAVNTVPVVAALADAVPHLDLRVLARDEHPVLMDRHLTNGARSIPIVVVLDEEYVELGWWGPRPAELQAWAMSPEARALSKDDRYRELRRWYARDRGRTTLTEIVELLERTAA